MVIQLHCSRGKIEMKCKLVLSRKVCTLELLCTVYYDVKEFFLIKVQMSVLVEDT